MPALTRFALLLSLAAPAVASARGPIPAVDLPSVVPDSVRDRVARELAGARDSLSRTVHPFRGEFHGLGSPAGGASKAYDLSANGRVVVGADRQDAGGSEGFVWSPWTGRSVYDMRPAGVSGDVVATAISADGVYVAGDVTTPSTAPWQLTSAPDFSQAFRWSLAGREAIPSPDGLSNRAAALSGDGGVLVGTNRLFPGHSPGCSSITDDGLCIPVIQLVADVPTEAFRYTASDGVVDLPSEFELGDAEAVGVSGDGRTLLGSISERVSFLSSSAPRQVRQPVLWRNGVLESLGGLESLADFTPPDGVAVPAFGARQATAATAISADGRTVVGENTFQRFSNFTDALFLPERTAVLWREETGWIDLGELKSVSYGAYNGAKATGVSGDGRLVIGEAISGIPPGLMCDCVNADLARISVPFLWDEARGMRELRDVLALDYGLDLAGWNLGEATAISDDGTTIIGNGVNPAGQAEAWRAVLERNTPHGDLDFDGDVDQFDFLTLDANQGATADDGAIFYADGDLNADGRIDGDDVTAFLSVYDHRWAGDFNADGLVDLGDYTLWRDQAGRFTGGVADADGDGWAGPADLAAWRSNFGRTLTAITSRTVPEPWTVITALVALAGASWRRG